MIMKIFRNSIWCYNKWYKLQLEPKRNFILATIKIDKNNLNSRIINSYENSKKVSASSNMFLFGAKKSGINNEEKYKNVIFI